MIPIIRLYNAGSTECFGDTGDSVANEVTQLNPCSPYGVAKASAFRTIATYRKAYNIFACTGILSNHESPLRPLRYVTRKIVHAAALVALGDESRLSLGNLDIERDWGRAPEYVEAISMMMEQRSPDDYVIATGQSHKLHGFVETAFCLVNKDGQDYVTFDRNLFRPTDIMHSKVDPSKAARCLGWNARNSMNEVISKTLEEEMRKARESHGL